LRRCEPRGFEDREIARNQIAQETGRPDKSKKNRAVAKPKIGRTPSVQKITTFLTFNDQAEEAMKLYTSVFRNSKILGLSRYGEEGPGPRGTVMSGTFELEGQPFIALNGGPYFTFAQGISLFVNCESQAEVDDLWRGSRKVEKSNLAAGSRTDSVSRGRSSRRSSARCCKTKTRGERGGSCKRCSRWKRLTSRRYSKRTIIDNPAQVGMKIKGYSVIRKEK